MKAVQGVCRFASSLAQKCKFWLFFKEADPFPLLGIRPEPIALVGWGVGVSSRCAGLCTSASKVSLGHCPSELHSIRLPYQTMENYNKKMGGVFKNLLLVVLVFILIFESGVNPCFLAGGGQY